MDYGPICGLVLRGTTSPPPKLETGWSFVLYRTLRDCFVVRCHPTTPPPTKRIKHERSLVEGSGHGLGRSVGRVKPEAALVSARHRDGRASTPRSVIVISDTEDDADAPAAM